MIPTNAADDYDVRLHAPSSGSKDGFGAYLAWSADGLAGNTDFVVSNYNVASAIQRDLGVINWNAGAGDYVIEKLDAPYVGFVSPGFYSFGPYMVDVNHVLNAQEFYVDESLVGSPLYVSLDILGGSADLDLEIFGPLDDFSSKYGGVVRGGASGVTTDEHLSFVPEAGGYYCAVVQKKGTPDLLQPGEYRLVISTTNAVDSPVIDGTPDRFALAAPQPNPFGAESQIRYDVPANGGRVALSVYDLRGRRVATLVDGVQPAGRHSVRWNGADSSGRRIAAGVYFLRLESAEGTSTKKITLLR